MHILTKVVAVVATASFFQGTGIFLSASAAVTAKEPAVQKWGDGSTTFKEELSLIGLQQKLSQNESTAAAQAHKTSIELSQYSDNPTMPGEGTPQRSQGSGTR
jgi:hypothetical protein